jgi:hypothetical protein
MAQDEPWTIGGGNIKMSGLIDSYYSYNFNHPASGFNTLRNFEVKANQFSLNMAEFSLYQDADPIGFRLDLGFGRAWDVFHATDPGNRDIVRYFPQAYVSLKPKSWGGLQFDFGKFYTSVGAELTENNYTWHYGRGYMYTNGPYYHMGLRVTKPLSETFAVGFQLVNGWNNVEDNNSGKTIGLTAAWTPKNKKVSLFFASYMGPEKNGPSMGTITNPNSNGTYYHPDNNQGWRGIWDFVLNYSPTSWWTGYLDYYTGQEKQAYYNGGPTAKWQAAGVSSKFTLSTHHAVALRYEWFDDGAGFPTGYGSQVTLQEFTATYLYRWKQGLEMRTEYRHDLANRPFFERGNDGNPLNPGFPTAGTGVHGPYKHQDTLTIGFIAFFGGK